MRKIFVLFLIVWGLCVVHFNYAKGGESSFFSGDSLLYTLRLKRAAVSNFAIPFAQEQYATHLLYSVLPSHGAITVGKDDYQKQNPRYIQEGTSKREWQTSAETFLKKGAIAAFTKAGYGNALLGGVALNHSDDYQLLAPFVMGDTVAQQNRNRESYFFSGGFARKYNLWNWGINASYKAVISSFYVDPRPKNLTTCFQLSPSVGFVLGDHCAVIVYGTAGTYKQSNEVLFMSELGVPSEYHFLGLSQDYYRFRGNNTENFYKGYLYSAGLDLLPVDRKRKTSFFAGVRWQLFAFDKILKNLNQLSMAQMHTGTITSEAGLQTRLSQEAILGIKGSYRCERRVGTVFMYGDAAAGIYPRIASLPLYESLLHQIKSEFMAEYMRGSWYGLLSCRVDYETLQRRLLHPQESVGIAVLKESVLARIGRTFDHWALEAEMEGCLSQPHSRKNILDVHPTKHSLQAQVDELVRSFEHNSKRAYSWQIGVRCSRSVMGKFVASVFTQWQNTRIASQNNHYLNWGIEFFF